MKKHWYIYLLVIIASSLLLTGCTKKEDTDPDAGNDTQQEEVKEDENLANLEDFGKTKQVVGESSEYEYSIDDIQLTEGEDYHEFRFEMSSSQEGATRPLFTVEPILTKGVYRVSLTNIFKDSTSITHSKGIVIDKGAITGLNRVVTDSDTTRAYDIGVLGNNLFKVDIQDIGDGEWIFAVQVSYDTKYTPPSIDFGSSEFSSQEQRIEGVTSEQGAKITEYSFVYASGVLKFTFEVSSGASNPIPDVNAKYDDEGLLIVTFPSLEQDKVSSWSKTIKLPSGVTLSIVRANEESIYTFSGISNKKPFKLSASQSPNLVIMEIDL